MNLQEFFTVNPKTAIAFSGGVDSAYLLYAAKKYGEDVKAYYVKSQFQPMFELEDAKRLAKELGADMKVIGLDILSIPEVIKNPENRCYFCKKAIFSAISSIALEDGYTTILDGTNASDDAGDRPGMIALQEMAVLSPLRECGLTKTQIRSLSKKAGLFTWDKPAYACLATRIPAGQVITEKNLTAAEEAEKYLFKLGFTDFRVRSDDGHARIQLPLSQFGKLLELRENVLRELKRYYRTVSLDLEARG